MNDQNRSEGRPTEPLETPQDGRGGTDTDDAGRAGEHAGLGAPEDARAHGGTQAATDAAGPGGARGHRGTQAATDADGSQRAAKDSPWLGESQGGGSSEAGDTTPMAALSGDHEGPDQVVRAAMEPANRARLLLATAVVTAVNMLLLLLLLAVTWTGPEQLVVDGERCIISETDGENTLFCEQ